MEYITCNLSAELFDKAVHGGLDDNPVLPEGRDLAIYVKPKATEGGKAGVVITFTVQLPDGTLARAQAVTTATILEDVSAVIRGWRQRGQI